MPHNLDTAYHNEDANLKVLQLKPISPLEQNHGSRGVCGGGWVSFCHFPWGCQLCAKGAELESRLVPRMAVDEKNVSVISGDQLFPYQLMCVLQIRNLVCASLTIWCWPKIPLQIHLCSSGEPQSCWCLVFTLWCLEFPHSLPYPSPDMFAAETGCCWRFPIPLFHPHFAKGMKHDVAAIPEWSWQIGIPLQWHLQGENEEG